LTEELVLKNKKNSGFTLVELIVVLVILAILAAILVPMLLGYIDDARKKQDIVAAKSTMTAIQSQLAITYGLYPPKANDNDPDKNFNIFSGMSDITADKLNQNVYLSNKTTISEFTKKVFEKAGLEKPYVIVLYTLKLNSVIGSNDVKDAYTVYSIVYWGDKSRKPLFLQP